MRPKTLLPYWSVFFDLPLVPFLRNFRRIKAAGFNGVEILLMPRVSHNPDHLETRTTHLRLDLHWHQCASLEESPRVHAVIALDLMGLLQPKGYRLRDQIARVKSDSPVVCYPDRITEIISMHRPPKCWIQTAITERPKQPSFEEFFSLVTEHRLPVVFDTQHVLELWCGRFGIEKLVRLNRQEMMDIYSRCWKKLRPLVKEIHLADCDPSRGHNVGRNLFLGEGTLPLKGFIQDIVLPTGWEGLVVPEVHPRSLGFRRISELRKKVLSYFE